MSDIDFKEDSGHGGIVGGNHDNGIIQYCFNKGNLNQAGYAIGGIACTNLATIQYCYNTGNVSLTSPASYAYGIGSGGTIKNCYNIGKIMAPKSIFYQIGGPDATIQNSYWLGTNLDDATCKEAESMKTQAFVDLLNSEDDKIFSMDATEINSGYPILSWQKEIQTENNG